MSEEEKPTSEAGKPPEKAPVTRRDFINDVATGALGIAAAGAAVVTVKYLSPNVLFEPPTRFHAGEPADYPVNSVTYIEDQQVYIVRTDQGFFAESAVCTHLGCITKWNPEANQIQCPCHGSRYSRNGTVERGPAPRPLPHFSIQLTPDGTLLVDKLEIVKEADVLKV
jgi:cytochrome b6-f complex iron-sulfur subunit